MSEPTSSNPPTAFDHVETILEMFRAMKDWGRKHIPEGDESWETFLLGNGEYETIIERASNDLETAYFVARQLRYNYKANQQSRKFTIRKQTPMERDLATDLCESFNNEMRLLSEMTGNPASTVARRVSGMTATQSDVHDRSIDEATFKYTPDVCFTSYGDQDIRPYFAVMIEIRTGPLLATSQLLRATAMDYLHWPGGKIQAVVCINVEKDQGIPGRIVAQVWRRNMVKMLDGKVENVPELTEVEIRDMTGKVHESAFVRLRLTDFAQDSDIPNTLPDDGGPPFDIPASSIDKYFRGSEERDRIKSLKRYQKELECAMS